MEALSGAPAMAYAAPHPWPFRRILLLPHLRQELLHLAHRRLADLGQNAPRSSNAGTDHP